MNAPPAAFSAELNISGAELNNADDQQHDSYASHAQEVVPVHAHKNRIQVKDGERH